MSNNTTTLDATFGIPVGSNNLHWDLKSVSPPLKTLWSIWIKRHQF